MKTIKSVLRMNRKLNIEVEYKEDIQAPGGDTFFGQEWEDIQESINSFGDKTVSKLFNSILRNEPHEIKVSIIREINNKL